MMSSAKWRVPDHGIQQAAEMWSAAENTDPAVRYLDQCAPIVNGGSVTGPRRSLPEAAES